MTRAQMFATVQNWIGLQDMQQWDESQFVYDAIYQGTIDLLARTKCTARCVDLHVSAGVDTYTLDHSVLALVDVEDGHRGRARRDLPQSDLPGVIVYPPDSTPPWSLPAPTFTLIRSDVLRFAPPPDTDGDIDVWAVLKPAQMVLDTDSPADEAYGAIPFEYHDAIVTYALWKAADYSDDQGSQQGERYRVIYEGNDGRSGRIGQIKGLVNRRGTSRGPRARVRLRGNNRRWVWVG
jgi:hypothetical protein